MVGVTVCATDPSNGLSWSSEVMGINVRCAFIRNLSLIIMAYGQLICLQTWKIVSD